MSSSSVQFAEATLSQLSSGAVRRSLERILGESIVRYRWFGGKARTVRSLSLLEVVPLAAEHGFVLLGVGYLDGEPEEYLMPLSLGCGPAAEKILAGAPASIIARVQLAGSDESAVLYDSMADEQAAGLLLELVRDERELAGQHGRIVCHRTGRFVELRGPAEIPLQTTILKGEQSNSSVLYGDRLILKLFRRPERGINPEVEMTTYLTESVGFKHVPPVAGAIEYRREGEPIRSLAVVQGFVPNKGVAWQYTLDHLSRYFAGVLAQPAGAAPDAALAASGPLVGLADRPLPDAARRWIGSFLQDAELLGRRTAELHLALAGETVDEDFAPQPYTPAFQRSLYSAACSLTERTFQLLKGRLPQLAAEVQTPARRLLELEAEILDRFRAMTQRGITGLRIRVHGDYHLGQVLYTGQDFVIIDFEGEPTRPLAERRIKTSPLRDVAGMLRSFHYAANSALANLRSQGVGGDPAVLEPWARIWNAWTGAAFLRSYLHAAAGAALLPESRPELQMLLDTLLLEKAVYELQYELNNRPDWVSIPLEAVLELADQPPATA